MGGVLSKLMSANFGFMYVTAGAGLGFGLGYLFYMVLKTFFIK
jgi:hypothetical protein